jgi:hypothetical protein
MEDALTKQEIIRLLLRYGADFKVEKPPSDSDYLNAGATGRSYASSADSLRRNINCGDFRFGMPSDLQADVNGFCRWLIHLEARLMAKTPLGRRRTDLFYELIGPSKELLRELRADEQVAAIAKSKKLPPKKSLKERHDTI